MNKRKFMFKSPESSDINYQPAPSLHSFYQICHFKNHLTGKYDVRKSVVDQDCNIIKVDEYRYNDSHMQKFFKEKRKNEYKIYSTFDIKVIDYPKKGDILETQSNLLNNDSEFTGYALF